jgi:hypothetical protein
MRLGISHKKKKLKKKSCRHMPRDNRTYFTSSTPYFTNSTQTYEWGPLNVLRWTNITRTYVPIVPELLYFSGLF